MSRVDIHNKIKCLKCGSDNVIASEKGFGTGKAALGMLAAGPSGLLAGFIGSKAVQVTCLNCGYKWKADASSVMSLQECGRLAD